MGEARPDLVSIPLAELTSKEPADLPAEVPIRLRFGSVIVMHPRTGQEHELEGAVDFTIWDSCAFTFTDPETHTSKVVPGLCLVVSELEGVAVRRRLNVISKRLVDLLRPFLESGKYRELRFTITKHGVRPKVTYEVRPETA